MWTTKDTVQKHTAMSQDQFKNAPKYFQQDRSIYFMVPFNKQNKNPQNTASILGLSEWSNLF